MLYAFIYGVILTFGLIIPLGMQNVFIFNQGATQKHFLHATPSILTAAICDAILILCAVLGVSLVVFTIPWFKTVFFLIGFFFLSYIGWVTWRSKPATLKTGMQPFSAKKQIAFATSFSLLNPHALLDTIGVIGTSALNFSGNEKWAYTLACIIVEFLWFFGLALAGHFVGKLDKTGMLLTAVNKISAVIIWGVAAYLGWHLVGEV
jgi:L-lysine exporter family protein LysE/ArgO